MDPPGERDLEGLVPGDKGGQFGEGLLARPAHAHKESVAAWISNDPGDLQRCIRNASQNALENDLLRPSQSRFQVFEKRRKWNITLVRWIIASLKNTRSMPVPRTISLYWARNIWRRSSRAVKDGMGSYTFGISMSRSSASSPVGSGASLLAKGGRLLFFVI